MKTQFDYSIKFNKIFTGSFLKYNLGHEIINYIQDDTTNQHYVYMNPVGRVDKNHKPDLICHVMRSSLYNDAFELVSVSSELEENPNYDDLKMDVENSPVFKGHPFAEIFPAVGKTKVYSYKANVFLKQSNKRIFLKFASFKEDKKLIKEAEKNGDTLLFLKCRLQYHTCWAILGDEANNTLKKLIMDPNYFEASKNDFDLKKIDDELCFSVISDRTNLEDSLSNLIAYFLNRDKDLCRNFLKDICGSKITIDDSEEFNVIREEKHIDLLFKSKKHIIVIENKIDSSIVPHDKCSDNGLIRAQLSDYYDYVLNDESFKSINKKNKHFFVLSPKYNFISESELKKYIRGNKYVALCYDKIHSFFKTTRIVINRMAVNHHNMVAPFIKSF